jgi:predicted double-glycine peptidase
LDTGSTTEHGEFVYYCQGNYKKYSYGYGKSIAQAGCGPTSLAMILTYYTGRKVTPVETAKYAMDHNYRIKNNGTSDKLFGSMCEAYGVKGEYQKATAENIVAALKQGKKIIAHMGPGTFTKGGHYIVLKGITSDGKVQVADPNHPNYNNKTFSASLIAKESKGRMYVAG